VTVRLVGLLARAEPSPAAPPGVDGRALRRAFVEDTYEVLAGLELVRTALVLCPQDQPDVADLVWPGTPLLGIEPAAPAEETHRALTALAAAGGEAVALFADDVPDLPGLLVGKLFRALGSAEVAACPAEGGRLVALACRTPVPGWLTDARVGLDTDDALPRLRAAAPSRRAFAVGPGWRRLRRPADLHRLDQGLEGWDATRALLGRAAPPAQPPSAPS
jgi:hypothetical protein